MPSNSLIGNLAVTLGLNTAAFERGATQAEARARTLQGRLSKIGDAMKGFAGGLIAGVGVSVFAGIAKGAFDMAAALDESAQKMGVSVEALQELNLAATQSGISQESLAAGIQRMNKSIGNLAQGAKPAVDAFAKIGLSFEDLKGKTPEVQLGIIADKLNQLPDVQQRVAIGSQIMGKNFSELLPLINLGSKGLDDYAQKQRQQGEISTEEAKRLDELSDSWERLKVRVGVAAAKIIAMFAELSSKMDDWLINTWYPWRDGVIQATAQMADGAISNVQRMVEGIASRMRKNLHQAFEDTKNDIHTVGEKFRQLYDDVVAHSYVPDMVKGIGDSMSQLQKIMVDPTLSATERVGAAFQNLAGLVSNVFGQKAGGLLSSIGQLVSAFAPLFGGGPTIDLGPLNVPSTSGTSLLPGLASGGGGVFGGRAGVDKNILSMNGSPIMRVSKGERFTVANDASPMAKVLIVPTPYFDAHVQGQAAAVAAPMAGQAAVVGASGAMSGMSRQRARTIP